MLDPLSALGLVSNIVQLISFTTEIIEESRAYVNSNEEILPSYEHTLHRLEQEHALHNDICRVDETIAPLNREERAVKDLAECCMTESQDLIHAIQTLSILSTRKGKRKFGSAVKTVFKAKRKSRTRDIEHRRQALVATRDQLNLALVVLIRRDQGLHFVELRQVIECRGLTDYHRLLDAKAQIIRAVETLQRQYDLESQGTLRKLTDLEVSVSHAKDALVSNHVQNQEILSETAQISTDVREGMATLESDLHGINDLLKLENEQKRAKRILSSLHFSDMKLRHETIPDAHSKTFEWVFNDETSLFRNWLTSSKGIFWVNGKAGSGKSTLMKYLASDRRTMQHLQNWSKNAPLVMIDFYFWYLGSPLQKSEEGLLRSILYQIFRACPEYMRTVTRLRWEDKIASDESWSVRELRQAIEDTASSGKAVTLLQHRRLSSGRKATQRGVPKFCFFIDGLDEYHADHLRLIELLQTLSTKLEIKLCISSRPWNVFQEAFGNLREQLVLEALTQDDIKLYVSDNLKESYPKVTGMQQLANEVTTKAQGVFLWVHLTVRSLQEGVAEGDSIATLRERLAQLPSDLGDFFQLILSRVHPVYKKSKTMTALYLAMAATRHELRSTHVPSRPTRSFLNFWMLREGLIEDPSFALRDTIEYLDQDTCNEHGQRTRTFLSAICKDLLYLPFPQAHGEGRYRARSEVEFLHRTVYEFLDSDEMRPKIEAGTMRLVHQSHFNVSMTLARMKMERIEDEDQFLGEVVALTRQAAQHEVDRSTELGQLLVTELENLAGSSIKFLIAHNTTHSTNSAILALANLFEANCYLCATEVLKTSEKIHQPWCYDAILEGALGLKQFRAFMPGDNCPAFLDYFLPLGVTLNRQTSLSMRSPWELFLCNCIKWVNDASSTYAAKDFKCLWETTKVLVRHGADLHAILQDGCSTKDALLSFVPEGCRHELEGLYATNDRYL